MNLGQSQSESPITGWLLLGAVVAVTIFYAVIRNRVPGLRQVMVEKKDIEDAREQILDNLRAHCSQIYKETTPEHMACQTAAAIAAAEITDVFGERFGLDLGCEED